MGGFFQSWHPIFDAFFVTFFLVCLHASHVTGNSSSSWLFLSGCKYHHLFTTPLLLDIPFLLQAELCRSSPRQMLDPGPTSRIQIASKASWHLFLLCFLVPTGIQSLLKLCSNVSMWVCLRVFVHMLTRAQLGMWWRNNHTGAWKVTFQRPITHWLKDLFLSYFINSPLSQRRGYFL